MRSALLRPKIKGRYARSNVSSVAALSGNGRKALTTTRLLRRGMKGAGETAGSRRRKWSRSCRETFLMEAVMARSATAVAVVLHRRTGCEDVRIEDIGEGELKLAVIG